MPWDIIGHTWAVDVLRADVGLGRPRHAYLLAGPSGVGKRTLAAAFAQALLCSAADAPCGHCRSCGLAAKDAHPDLFTLAPVVSGKRILSEKIRIEPVRELVYQLSLKPVEASRRVARLIEFSAAEPPAQNALLKTLEEPPGPTVMILTASRPDDLLPTIVSRCTVLELRRMPVEQVQAALMERWDVPAARAELLAHLSGGRLGHAVRSHLDPHALEDRGQRLDELCRLMRESRVGRLAYVEALSRSGDSDQVQELLEEWQSFLSDLLLISLRAGAPRANPDRGEVLNQLAGRISPRQAQAAIRTIQRTRSAVQRNANLRLALDVLVLDLPRL